jgi:hypothetical protein
MATFTLTSPTDSQTKCATWRTNVLAIIKKTPPAAVIISERTTNYLPNGTQPTNAQWTTALETTLQAIKSVKTKVIVVGDIPIFNEAILQCLSLHLSSVQDCDTSPTNAVVVNQDAHLGEQAAAQAAKVGFVNPISWLCSTKCSAVIGSMVAYYDSRHISAIYASYLSTVMGAAIKKLL